ncbi:uncharacterized protein KQ657_001496 [Scheffersomyces spartinae]|uniref:Uncharacterized protein n=1 Tax=Scheffersomyces spartinae TaxID=45513 RepID=A0A9P7V7C3_9ASCO|nr:uncharacterized protein KQ657_001496 [Scheffersomyces spartinae]KAG7192713.1 hypothetical protein KQ657_001496 [Scheffersomyces spartinae]
MVDDTYEWNKTPPLALRPFKKKYNMTMGISTILPQDWFNIEWDHKKITDLKKRVVSKHEPYVLFNDEACDLAIHEYYEMVVKILLIKYPKYYKQIKKESGHLRWVHDTIRDEYLPDITTASQYTSRDLLRYLLVIVEEDFLLLLKDDPMDPEYKLKGGSWCLPSGFDPVDKFNNDILTIHLPVPYYQEKLKTSMNKYLSRVDPHKFVTRSNWTVQAHPQMFALATTKDYDHENHLKTEELDFNDVVLRVERQVVTKLPRLKAIVFTIKTYLTPLTQLKLEGNSSICEAIAGIDDRVGEYKRTDAWAPAVLEYMNNSSKPENIRFPDYDSEQPLADGNS